MLMSVSDSRMRSSLGNFCRKWQLKETEFSSPLGQILTISANNSNGFCFPSGGSASNFSTHCMSVSWWVATSWPLSCSNGSAGKRLVSTRSTIRTTVDSGRAASTLKYLACYEVMPRNSKMPSTEENQATIFADQNARSFTEFFTVAARGAGASRARICSSSMMLKDALVQKQGHQY